VLQPLVLEVKISLTYLMNTKHDHSEWRVRQHIVSAKNRSISLRINTNVIRSMGLWEEVQGILAP
jgi:hypothetical protein